MRNTKAMLFLTLTGSVIWTRAIQLLLKRYANSVLGKGTSLRVRTQPNHSYRSCPTLKSNQAGTPFWMRAPGFRREEKQLVDQSAAATWEAGIASGRRRGERLGGRTASR